DGEDYRRRDGATEIATLPEDEVVRSGDEMHEATLDRFDPLLQNLTYVTPSRYGAMIDDVTSAHATGLHSLAHHPDALCFVVLVSNGVRMHEATPARFHPLLLHLTSAHPSRYGAMIDDVSAAHVTGMHGLAHHHDALRFVVLVDRLYDREVPVLASLDGGAAPGVLADLFSDELLRSGYRKKYLRALSRLASLTDDGGALLRTGAADAAS